MKYDCYESPVGLLRIGEDEVGICALTLHPLEASITQYSEGPFSKLLKPQLDEYFSGKRTHFNIPLSLKGTPFQIKVWHALCDIPYGETRCYQEIAQAVGCPKGSRAIGLANNKNPIAIIVPCHRVIGKNGSLVGYGLGIEMKQFLLELEKRP